MADLIHRWSEEKIPEYEQMMRVGIFSEDEIRSIIKKITALEYKLVRKVKVKEDYLAFIQYNIHLLSLIKKRRKRINYYFKKDEIEFAIVSRIHRTFKQCTFRWPEDVKLWSSHIDFCKVWNKRIQLSKIWTSMLQFHGNTDVNLWLMAAKWEYEDNHSVESARQIFLRGIRHFPDDPKIWQAYFQMELIHVMKTRQRLALLKDTDQPEDVDEEYLKGGAAKIIYKNAVETLEKESSVKCGFLDIAVRFASFAGEVVNMIIEDLYRHDNDVIARSTLAKLHLSPAMVKLGLNDSRVVKAADMWNAEKRCWEDFEVAVEELRSPEMWHEYLCFIMSRIGSCSKPSGDILLDSSPTEAYVNERREKLSRVFKRAHELKVLKAESYLEYIKRLVSEEKHVEAVGLLQECAEILESTSIWLRLLELVSECGNLGVEQLIQEAVARLRDGISDLSVGEKRRLWVSWSRCAQIIKSDDLLWQGLKLAKKHSRISAAKFAIPILNSQCSQDVETGFGVYKNRLLPLCPNSFELFDAMLTRLLSMSPANRKVLDCFETSMDYLGKCSAEFWLRYVTYAMEFDRGKVASLHWKAMKTLDAEHVATFSEGFADETIEEIIRL